MEYAISALEFASRMETTILPPEAAPLKGNIIASGRVTAERIARGPQPAGLSIPTDGSPTGSGAVGDAVT